MTDDDQDPPVRRPTLPIPRCPRPGRLPPFTEGCQPILDLVRREVPELKAHTDAEVATLWAWFSEETAAQGWLELSGADPFVMFLARQMPDDWRHAWADRP